MGLWENGVGAGITNTGSTMTATISTNGPGRLILLAISHDGTTYLTSAPTIGGNVMTLVPGGQGINVTRGELWSYQAATQLTSAAVSVALVANSGGGHYASMKVDSYDGPTAVDVLSVTNQASSGGSSGTYNSSATTTKAYDWMVAYSTGPNGPLYGTGTGCTGIGTAGSGNTAVVGEYVSNAVATPGSVSVPFTYTPGTPANTVFVLGLRTGPLMASVTFSGTTGILTWTTASGGIAQASGFGATQGLSGTASGGAFTISGVSTTGLVTTFTTSRALGAGETGTLSTLASAFTDNSSTTNPCPAGTIPFTIAGSSAARNLTVGVYY